MIRFIIASLILIACVSCGNENQVIPSKPNLVIAGTEYNNDTGNGRVFTIINSKKEYLSDLDYNSDIYGHTVNGNDVYVYGWQTKLSTNETLPTYWKNGNKVVLPITYNGIVFKTGEIVDIMAIGNDVYALGSLWTLSKRYIVYWKNGVLTVVTSGVNQATPIKLSINKSGSLSILGSEEYGSVTDTKIWSSGSESTVLANKGVETAQVLSDGSFLMSFADWSGTKLAMGYSLYGQNTIIDPSNSDEYIRFLSIAKNGNDVYCVGRVTFDSSPAIKPVYWKNGGQVTLPVPNGSRGVAMNIFFKGNDIYIVGYVKEPINDSFENSFDRGVIWKNGVMEYITDSGVNSLPYSITY